jgi:Icc protein
MHADYNHVVDEAICLIQITDTHICADPDAELGGVNTRRSLSAVLQHISARGARADAILATGDLSHDSSPESYIALRDALQSLETPVFCIPGNHDDPGTMQRFLAGGWVVCAETAEFGPWQTLLLNTHVPGCEGGRLGTKRLEEVNEVLGRNPRAPTLIVLHHPPVPIGSPWMDAMGLADAPAFLDIIDRNPQIRAVLWGHIHQEFEQSRHGVWFWATPSTCVQFKPGVTHYTCDDLPPGYRCITLAPDGSLATEVLRVAVPP